MCSDELVEAVLERLSSSQAANEDHTEGARVTEDLAPKSVDNTTKVENKVNPNRQPGKFLSIAVLELSETHSMLVLSSNIGTSIVYTVDSFSLIMLYLSETEVSSAARV